MFLPLVLLITALNGQIWPQPTSVVLGGAVQLNLCNIQVRIATPVTLHTRCLITAAYKRANLLLQQTTGCDVTSTPLIVGITLGHANKTDVNPVRDLPYVDAYALSVAAGGISISAATPISAMRAAWSLIQLANGNGLVTQAIRVVDQPNYQYRSILVDTTRSLTPYTGGRHDIQRIYEIIDKMEVVKLNVLHWHLGDTDGISFEFDGFNVVSPYKQSDLILLTTYALQRGVSILPDVDFQGHSGKVWATQSGMADFSFATAGCPDQINLDSNLATGLAYKIYQSMFTTFFKNAQTFGIGNDEVSPCGIDYPNSINTFNSKITTLARASNKTLFTWADTLLEIGTPFDRANVVVAPWKIQSSQYADYAAQINYLCSQGYSIIIANQYPWYIGGGTTESTLYNYNFLQGVKTSCHASILGGLVALWEPSVDDLVNQWVLWPKSVSVAENLWSSPRTTAKGLDAARYAAISNLIMAITPPIPSNVCQ